MGTSCSPPAKQMIRNRVVALPSCQIATALFVLPVSFPTATSSSRLTFTFTFWVDSRLLGRFASFRRRRRRSKGNPHCQAAEALRGLLRHSPNPPHVLRDLVSFSCFVFFFFPPLSCCWHLLSLLQLSGYTVAVCWWWLTVRFLAR